MSERMIIVRVIVIDGEDATLWHFFSLLFVRSTFFALQLNRCFRHLPLPISPLNAFGARGGTSGSRHSKVWLIYDNIRKTEYKF